MAEVITLISYYAREKLYRHVQAVCNSSLKKRGDDPVLIFWKAFGLVNEGSVADAIRELENIQGKRDVQLAVTSALIAAHNKFARVERDAVAELQAQLPSHRNSASEKGLMTAGQFHLLNEEYDKAREYVKKVLESQPNYTPALVLLGWVELLCGKEAVVAKSTQHFDKALAAEHTKDIDALLGKAKYLEMRQQYASALDTLNQVIVLYEWFTPALMEKAKVLMMMGDWEQCYEVTSRVQQQDPYNIDALRLLSLYHLVREGRYSTAAGRLAELLQSLDRFEPKNHQLYYAIAYPMARVAGRDQGVLQQTITMIERCKTLQPDAALYCAELGHQLLMAGQVKQAVSAYKAAMKLDEACHAALNGLIKCQILDGQLADAEQQLEFLHEITDAKEGKVPELIYLAALLAWRRHVDQNTSVKLLSEAVETHFRSIKEMPIGLKYFAAMNPDFLVEVAKEYLQHCGTDPLDASDPPSPTLTKAIKLLELILRAVPGLLECHFLLARTKYIINDDEAAHRTVDNCLRLNPSHADAHMLMSQIELKADRPKAAAASLEQCLSHNFEVKDTAMYYLQKARIHQSLGEYSESLKVLQEAMALAKEAATPNGASLKTSKDKRQAAQAAAFKVSLYDKVSLYLELATTYVKLDQLDEAAKVYSNGMNEIRGTVEEVRLLIAHAQFMLKKGQIETAIGMLGGVTPDLPYYVKAQTVLAAIHLHQRNDKRMYIDCYRKMVESDPTVHTCCLLGDAFMKIQEPEQAIKAYQIALEQNPKDTNLPSKIGKAMIITHDYNKALSYYESAVKGDPTNSQLKYELAELYTKLRKFERAEKLLKDSLADGADPNDYTVTMKEVKIYLLMSKVSTGASDDQASVDALLKARELQNSVLQRIRGEQSDFVRQQKGVAANICYELGNNYNAHNQPDKALQYYNEALRNDESHEKSILALAKLHLARGELDACQNQCVISLRMDPSNEEAAMMLADLMFRKNEYEAAIFHFQGLLERKPNHYVALSRLIQLLRRAGKLSEVPKFLKMAESLSARAALEAGFHYCKGLYARYTNNPREALTEFYAARKDSEFGTRVLEHMIEIYINPDNEIQLDQVGGAGPEADKEFLKSVQSARDLLREIPPMSRTMKHQVLECYTQMVTKNKADVEAAIATLGNMIAADKNYVPALLALAEAHLIRKETPKARNHLKRVAKMPYNSDEAEEFERSWLLLADIFIQQAKYDLASELLKRCLAQNKSCAKAWEALGFIMEKEQSYRDASEHYEAAWRMENHSNAGTGFRLAFNYLKAKRYVEAIDVCHKVLAAQPDYPKIRKDILERARSCLRS